MKNFNKIGLSFLIALLTATIICCDCADDGELRRLENEKEAQTQIDSLS